ncbi:MAG: hypothetical protein ACMZ66_21805 [Thalassospira sp.]|uniref:hypothetical protein n=1 Tax=Thalassospira sp. TaxID=1912094 RepID=UPI003A876544
MSSQDNFIPSLPAGLNIQEHAPHKPYTWSRNETCFSKSGNNFVSAFNIREATMMNEEAKILWGKIVNGEAIVIGKLVNVNVYCWERPFAHWLDELCFTVKAAHKVGSYPIIAVHFEKGIQTISGLDHINSRAKHATQDMLNNSWLKYNPALELKAP